MTESPNPWSDRAFLRDVQYRTDANLAARQSMYAYQHPRIELQPRVLDLAAPAPGETVADVGCGNGLYLAELARRGFAGRVLGLDMSPGMLSAARERLNATAVPPRPSDPNAASSIGPPVPPAADPTGLPAAGPAGPLAADATGLLAADATALPVRDGAVDLALAMHMLYHVPDPAQAVRELRRVTRPGGRVVIGLNGDDHLRELRDIVAAARGDNRWGLRERLTLDGGEALARTCFTTVTRHDFVSELRIPDPEPVADYVRSMSGTQHSADPELIVAAVVARLPTAPATATPATPATATPAAGAVFTVTTHAGCLICHS